MQRNHLILMIILFESFTFINTQGYVKYTKNSGFWSPWSSWSNCTLTSICRGGTRTRQRKCLMQGKGSLMSCSGEYVELEGCPKTDCTSIKPMIYTDIAEASMSSFISQECNTDIKYSVASKHGNKIPQPIFSRFKQKLMNFLHGFFNIEKLKGKPEIGLKNMTKVCFEPRDLKVKDLPSIYRFNRLVKASLSQGGKLSRPDDVISGVTVVIEDISNDFHGIYFALKGRNFGYKTVGYRRWRGEGVLEAL